MPSYKRPPITESVIELRFDAPCTEDEINKARDKLLDLYPFSVELQNINLTVDMNEGQRAAAKANVIGTPNGYRMISQDASEFAIIMPGSFVVSQMAPYPGWEAFFERFAVSWRRLKPIMGHKRFQRLGMRYLNRIDIPAKGAITEESDFLTIFAKSPESFGAFRGYGLQLKFGLEEVGGELVINSGSVKSPLLGHVALLLDLDLSVSGAAMSMGEEAMANLLSRMRQEKNRVFEACITDASRELFAR